MPLLLPVLVRGINNLSDARYCAGMGADGLIFTLDPALPGAVDAATVKELAGWVAGVEIIGEFGGAMPVSEINRLVEECSLTRVLLHYGEERAEILTTPHSLSVPILVEASPLYVFDEYERDCLLEDVKEDFPAGFSLLTEAAPFLRTSAQKAMLNFKQPLWLSGEFTPDEARQAAALHPAGLVLRGGDEIKPGIRDFDELEAIFEALEE